MNVKSILPAIAIMVFLILSGCGTVPEAVSPAATPSSKDKPAKRIATRPRPSNQYYHYTEAQLHSKSGRVDQAIQHLQKAIDLDPTSPFLKIELARYYLHQKDRSSALKVLQNVLLTAPENVKALTLYGMINQEMNNLQAAKKAYQEALTIDPYQERIYLILGRIYMEANDLDAASDIYQDLVTFYPESYAGHFYLGKIYAQTGADADAVKAFTRSLELEPDLEESRFELIRIFKSQGRSDDVLQTYKELLKRNQDNTRASLGLGLFYHEKGHTKKAREIFGQLGQQSVSEPAIFRKIVQLYLDPKEYASAIIIIQGMLEAVPRNSELHYLAGVAYDGMDKKQAAIDHLLKVGQDSRFYDNAVVHTALLYQESDQIHKAIIYLEDVISKVPGKSEFFLYLGSFYEEEERYPDAVEALTSGLEIEPENTKLLFRLGVVYDKSDRKTECIEKMKAVIRLDPENASALNYLGYTYADLGQNLDEAEVLIKKALQYKPDDGYITDSLGWVYYQKGRYDESLELLKKAVDLVPDDPIILEHLGDAYLKVDNKNKALLYYRKALERKNENQDDTSALQHKIRSLTGEGT